MTAVRPLHPGIILKERFLAPLGITSYRLAKSLGVSTRRISEVVRGNRSISPDTAIRLGLFFNVPPAWWLEMQAHFDTKGIPQLEELREQVKQYEGLAQIIVSPGGVRQLKKSEKRKSDVLLMKVPDDLMKRLRAQADLEAPRASRKTRTVTYANGASALVGV